MSRVDNSGLPPTRPSAPETPLYQDAAELQGLKSDLDRRVGSAQGGERGASPAARVRYWGRPPVGDGPVSSPPLAEGMATRPDGRELQQLLRRALHAHRATDRDVPPGVGETKMLATMQRLIDAQDRVAMRLAKLTKA